MCDGNYIKLNRKMLEWEWFSDANTYRVFTYCLLKANWKDARFEGRDIPRGSFVTSYPSMSSDLKLTARQIRTSINHLKVTGEVSVKITSKFSIITVNNYSRYQEDVSQKVSQASVKRQASVSQTTGECQSSVTNRRKKEDKEIKNNICGETPQTPKRTIFKPPTIEEVKKYITDKGYKVDAERFVDFYESKGWYVGKNKMKSWEAAVRTWEKSNKDKKSASQPKPNKFNSFEGQRDYDFADMEKQLLKNNR